MENASQPSKDSKKNTILQTTNPALLLSHELDPETAKQVENDFFTLLHTINERAMQLGEYIATETKTIHEICNNLQTIFHHLTLSVELPPSVISWKQNVQKAMYNDHGHLVLVTDDGGIESTALDQLSADKVLIVIWGVIPKLGEMVSMRLKHAEMRIGLFEKIGVNLRNLQSNFKTSAGSKTLTSREIQEQQVQELYLPVKS